VGKGVLYQYFSNRETLVATLVESEFDRLLSSAIDARQARADAPPLETARALLRMNVEAWLENRKLLKIILNEVPGVFDLPGVRRLEERLTEFTHSLVPPGLAGKRPADLDRKLHVLTSSVLGFFFCLVLIDPGQATAEEIVDELMALVRGYVECSGLAEWLSG
jgi:AcrR family transcriptional regulator